MSSIIHPSTTMTSMTSPLRATSAPRLKVFNPTTPGVRHKIRRVDYTQGDQQVPKSLSYGGRHTGGRNHTGRITCFHRGGGTKTVHRIVTNLLPGQTAVIRGIQWDPNRTAPLALAELDTLGGSNTNPQGNLIYLLAGEGLQVGQRIGCASNTNPQPSEEPSSSASTAVDIKANNTHPLGSLPIGAKIFNFKLSQHRKSHTAMTPGTSAEVIRHERRTQMTRLRLPSKELRWLFSSTRATLGQVGAKDLGLEVTGNAGFNRRRGVRPTVRGCAMNPIDHPHGGRTKGGLHDVTPWAKIAKGQPTRSPRKPLGFIVKTSRQVRLAAKKAS